MITETRQITCTCRENDRDQTPQMTSSCTDDIRDEN